MIIIKLNNYNVVIKNNICSINNKTIELTEEEKSMIIRIIRGVKDSHPSEEYIYIEEDKKTYYFNSPKPYSYVELLEYIGGLYDRC